MKRVTLCIIACSLAIHSFGQNQKLAEAAATIIDKTIVYDPSYVRIKYPMGDIDPKKGVCTDVVIRAYRLIGIDLQKDVHEDMKSNFTKYPKNWGKTEPDTNIDHRRVLNLKTFFERNGEVLPITDNPKDYKPGDIVIWHLFGGTYHIGIVSNVISTYSYANKVPGTLMIIHNIGGGQILEDCLFWWKIIGHYRYLGER